MTTIADKLIRILEQNNGEFIGIHDLLDQVPGDEPTKYIAIRQLEQDHILVRSKDCNGGRGHKRTVYLIRLRRLSPCGKS